MFFLILCIGIWFGFLIIICILCFYVIFVNFLRVFNLVNCVLLLVFVIELGCSLLLREKVILYVFMIL